jgi:hypothetical protein
MTWWRSSDGCYGVHFNRDEKKARALGEPPTVIERRGVSCIAPSDPQAGGTWILCNAFGLTVAVLNLYQAEQRQCRDSEAYSWLSRGEIPHLLGDAPDVDQALCRLRNLDMSRYRPVCVVLLDPHSEACLQSDGTERSVIVEAPIAQPLLSSSFAPEEVFESRREIYARLQCGAPGALRDRLRGFHHFTGGSATAHTPKMLRPDAQTFSHTELEIDSENVCCCYEAYDREFAGESQIHRCSIPRRSHGFLRRIRGFDPEF